MNIAELFVRVRGDTSDLTRKMSAAEKSIERFGKTAGKWLGLGLGAGLAVMIRESIEAQNALAQLEARIKSTGGAAGRSIEQLTAQASALQKITTYSDDAVQGAQALLLTFKQIRGDEFDRATKATLDLATAMGTDLKSAALQIGKALEDPVRGMNALRRSGVSFTKEQEEVIKKLAQTGEVAKAQNLMLAEMETQFGGAAEAARDTLGGALLGLKNAFTETLEVSGDASSGIVGAINGMADAMPTLRRQMETGFAAAKESLLAFKYVFQAAGGVVVSAISLMIEAWGRFAKVFGDADGKFRGEEAIRNAKRMREEVRQILKDTKQDIALAGNFRRPDTRPQTSGQEDGSAAGRFRGLPTATPSTIQPKTEEELRALAAAAKSAKEALWQSLDAQFRSAFDWFEESLRSSSSAMTRATQAVQSLSDKINLATAGIPGFRTDTDWAAIARGAGADVPGGLAPPAPQKFGFENGQLKLDPEAQAMVDQLKLQRSEALKNSDMMTGKTSSKLDEVKNAIFTSGALMQAAMMALGDKILVGGQGAGSRTGGGIGGLLGAAAGTLFKGLGVFGGPVGQIVGTVIGSAIGGLFDKPTQAANSFATAVNRAAASLTNTPAFARVERYRWATSPIRPMDTSPSAPIAFYGPVNFNGVNDIDQLRREVRREMSAGGLGFGVA